MIENKTTISEEKKAQEQSTIEKIRVLNGLLGTTVPVDNQPAYGECTKYESAFSLGQRTKIVLKIMELVKQL